MVLKNFLKIFFQKVKKISPLLTITLLLVFCTFLAGGIFFLVRRETGFFNQFMPLAGIFIFSVAFGATLLLIYLLIRVWTGKLDNWAVPFRRVLTGILLLEYLITGLAVQIPGTSILVQLVFALCFLLVAGILCRFEFHHQFSESKSEVPEEIDEESEEFDEEVQLPPGISQKLERLQNPDGSVEISGLLRADFLPNQMKVPLFVVFCPPFNQIPMVECFSLDGLAEVEIVQSTPHGAQLSVRKTQSVPFADSVVLTFRATNS